MNRTGLSRPVALGLEHGVITPQTTVLDYGCGKGGDIARLQEAAVEAFGWDPAFNPDGRLQESDVVNLGFVLNVIEEPAEREETLRRAWKLAKQSLIVAVRPEWEMSSVEGRKYQDGIMTSKGTFQKFFGHEEFLHLVRRTTEREPILIAPGIVFVFRDLDREKEARLLQVRRISRGPRTWLIERKFDENRELLEPLINFLEDHGRLPAEDSSDEPWLMIRERFGTLRSAFGVIRSAIGDDRWEGARKKAEEELSIFLALSAFGGRPRWGELSDDIQLDIRSLFGNYKAACAAADSLLFGLGNAEVLDQNLRTNPIGKVLPDALYIHISALPYSSPLIRLYEGCARVLIGDVPSANIVKLSRRERRVSYLSYPTFDSDAHPSLAESLRIDLQTFSMKHRRFDSSDNPPILHRKEVFVPPDYPKRDLFERLTRSEEEAGLFATEEHIGNRLQWEQLLRERGIALKGHKLNVATS